MKTRQVVLVALLGTLMALAGCVAVPTVGPVERIGGQQPACQNCVNVEVAPPTAGDDPGQIVEGYLRATSNFQPSYSVAKQFLTKSARETWSPEEGASIYRLTRVSASGSQVVLKSLLVGSLDKDRTFTAHNQEFNVTFQLVDENGEWRINNPPPGLMVAEYSFRTFFKAYDLYYIGNGAALVPDSIYLPSLRSPQNVASALVTALLNGPSRWLKRAVSTLIPTGTTLSVGSVTITDGIADVPLSDGMLTLTDSDRSMAAAQIVYTLKQSGIGIKGVVIRVNQQTLRVAEADPNTQVISVDAVPREMEPVSVVAGEQLYAVHEGRTELITSNADAPNPKAVKGPLGDGQFDVDSLAVSLANTDLAVVTDGRTVLRRAPTTTGEVQVLLSGVTRLLRPQFTRYGEIWAIGREAGKPRMWMFEAGQRPRPVDAPILEGGRITAFKISPDGTKMAMIRETANGSELGLARISRENKVLVDGWRTLNTTQSMLPQIKHMVDVAWIDPNDLLVLGAASKGGPIAPFRIAENASQISDEGAADEWAPVELTVLLRTQTAIILGEDGQTWKDDGSNWVAYVDKITALAYPG